jgi:hypothetical protein
MVELHGEGLQLGEAARTQPLAMRLNLSRAGRMQMQFREQHAVAIPVRG